MEHDAGQDRSAAKAEAPSFLADRPTDLRTARRWHRYAHHIRTMPLRLRELSRQLEVPAGGSVLDYGCAEVPYRDFVRADADYLAADLPGNPHATLEINPDGTLPLRDGTVDAVLSTQVLEHVGDPRTYIREAFRVLKPGGRMLLSTHGVFAYHPDPVDYWRWTGAGLTRSIEEAGFEVVAIEGIIGLAATGLQLIQDAIYYRVPAFARPVLALIIQSLMAVCDRLESDEGRRINASVFALVARRP